MTAAAAFAGGFVGSVASQGVGKATGQVESFSLRGAFASGLTTVATMGIGSMMKSSQYADGLATVTEKGTKAQVAAYKSGFSEGIQKSGNISKAIGSVLRSDGGISRAMLGTASSYAANKIAGLETSFTWGGFAAQAAGSYVGNKMGDYLGQGGLGWNPYVAGTVAGAVGGSVAGTLNKQWNGGGPVDYARIALDAFANQIGNAVVATAIEKGTKPAVVEKEVSAFCWPLPIRTSCGTLTLILKLNCEGRIARRCMKNWQIS